jgi:hypothetical protein
MSLDLELQKDSARAFRRKLAVRIFQVMAVALPGAALSAGGGCGTTVGSGGGGGGEVVQQCFAWPDTMTSGGGFGGNTSDAGVTCPSRTDALTHFQMQECGTADVRSDGSYDNGQCCYQVLQQSCVLVGRPYLVDGAPRAADPARDEGGWREAGAGAPCLDGLSSNDRAALAAAWAADGLFEHASVASFGRFALELLAVGAPADLVEAAHRAALDEVRHARLCLGLASAYAGEPIAPAAFPFGQAVAVSADLADIAARAAREGCVGETVAAVLAAEQLERAEDPAVRAALAIIAEDEARHAELAWRTVAWAIQKGGAPVRAAVADAIAAGIAEAHLDQDANAASPAMIAHGRLDAAARCQAVTRALAEVIGPIAAAAAHDHAAGRVIAESA